MSGHTSMVDLVEKYLVARRSVGFGLKAQGGGLLAFARYADRSGHRGPLTIALAVSWATSSSRSVDGGPARRLEVIRPFARYRLAFDPRTEVAPCGLLGAGHRRREPHVYSEREIRKLLSEIARLKPEGALRPVTFMTIFGLLACTGLRVSEALRLSRADVDLREGVLRVRETKFRKSRLVPLHDSARRVLGLYVRNRDDRAPKASSDAFFLIDGGVPVTFGMTRAVFVCVRRRLGWKSRRPAPRIHDLRHTFACRALLRWYQDGEDVQARIHALSTYLGHAKVTHTYWYLSATPELMALVSRKFEHFARGQS